MDNGKFYFDKQLKSIVKTNIFRVFYHRTSQIYDV